MKVEAHKPLSVFNYLWLLVIPLSYNFRAADPALYHKFLLTDLSLLAAVAILFKGKRQLPALSPAAYIFLGLYFISTLLALVAMCVHHINNADGWFIWLHQIVFPAFVLILLLTGNTGAESRKSISGIISLLALISVVIALVQYIMEISASGWSLLAADAIKATYSHKNIFAEVMFLTLPFTFYAFFLTRKKWYLLVLAASVIMIALCLSRAVLSAMVISGVISTAFYLAANFRKNIRWHFVMLALTGVLIVAVGSYVFIEHTEYGKHIISFYNYRNTIHERQSLWQSTYQLIKAYPVFGCGLGAWKILSMQYSMLGLRNYVTFFQQPHNDFLWIISEQGLISFVLLAAAWLYLVLLLLIQIFRKPEDVFNYCLLFALVGYFIYSNFGFPRERAEHGIILAFIASFILGGEKGKYVPFFPRATAIALAILLAGAAWWAGNKLICGVYMKDALECREANDLQHEFEYLNKINSTYYTLDGTATPVAWYLGMIYFAQHNNITALAEFTEALKYNPYHTYSLANVGACLSAAGDNNSAEGYFRRALTYSEGFPDAALNMCAIKYNKGDIDSAAWYLAMANDTLTDARYVKSLNVLTVLLAKPVMDSAARNSETPLTETCNSLLTHPHWQMDVFKKAYEYKRPVNVQIWMDVLWILKYRENEQKISDKYQKSLSLPAI